MTVAYHNNANTVIGTVTGSAPNWSGSKSGVIPINTLTANTIPLSTTGVSVASNIGVGSGAQTLSLVENMPVYSASLTSQSWIEVSL